MLHPRRYELEPPTFQQTVTIIQTLPRSQQTDRELIISRHLALGFTYDPQQIFRAMNAVNDHRARAWDHRHRNSKPLVRWTSAPAGS